MDHSGEKRLDTEKIQIPTRELAQNIKSFEKKERRKEIRIWTEERRKKQSEKGVKQFGGG